MTRFAIDAPTVIELARRGYDGSGGHQLVAPAPLRSEALSILYRERRLDRLGDRDAGDLLDRITSMKIRVLGDRVSRRTAWRIAQDLGLDDTRLAEYLAVCRLQADALIAGDAELRRLADGVVELAGIDAL